MSSSYPGEDPQANDPLQGGGPGPDESPDRTGTEPTAPMGYWERQADQSSYGPPPGYAASYPPGAGGPPPYGAYGPAVPDHRQATTALVLGLVGLVGGVLLCGLPLLASPFAWAIGRNAVKEIEAAQGALGGEGQARAGMVLGIIGTVLLVLVLLAVVAFAALVTVSSTTSVSSI